MTRRARSIGLVAAVAALLAAAPAGAQAPAAAGSPAILHYELDGFAPPIDGRIPSILKIAAPAGVSLDWKTLPKVCNVAAQALGDCGAGSRIVKGIIVIEVADPTKGTAREAYVPFNLFRGVRNTVVGTAVLADNSVQTIAGTIDTTGGLSMTLLIPKLVNTRVAVLRFKKLALDMGASRTMREKVGKKRKGHRQRWKTVHRDFLRLPATCPATGAWDAPLTLTFPDNSVAVAPNQVACAAAK